MTNACARLILSLSLILPLILGGCGGQSKHGVGEFCEVDTDCKIGLECRSNSCAEPLLTCDPPCNEDVEFCYELSCVVIADPNDKDGDLSLFGEDCDDFDRSVHPGAYEYCDGVDNDCDNSTDEGCSPCSDGESRLCGSDVGECGAGSQACAAGLWEPCSGAGPAPEKCDGLDNDCDGLTDEICPCVDGAEFPCGLDQGECVAGSQVCTAGAWPGCMSGEVPAEFEICNGLDDDCDGLTDEGFDLGAACAGRGVCGPGELECAGDLTLVCSTWPGGSEDQSTAEACDGLDNDCDEQTDEDFMVGAACEGVGACGPGIFECAGLDGARCSSDLDGSQYGGGNEVCDGLDNDCDGETDEGFQIGQPCAGIGSCGAGVYECASPGATRCSTHPDGSADQSQPEICDGATQDEDCDGETDEGFDLDDDGFYSCPSHGMTQVDCCDNDARAFPGQTDYTLTPHICSGIPGGAWDFNCDGQVEYQFDQVLICSHDGFSCSATQIGTFGLTPCGQQVILWTDCCFVDLSNCEPCSPWPEVFTQACR